MPSILFVCTANRFRSPIAAISFAREVVRHDDDHLIQISSAGTWTVIGQPATTEAIQEANKYRLNLSLHKSRPITREILSQADLVLVMESNHKEAISHEFPFIADRIFLLSEAVNGSTYDIPDPYASDESPKAIAHEIVTMLDRGYDQIFKLALAKSHRSEEL